MGQLEDIAAISLRLDEDKCLTAIRIESKLVPCPDQHSWTPLCPLSCHSRRIEKRPIFLADWDRNDFPSKLWFPKRWGLQRVDSWRDQDRWARSARTSCSLLAKKGKKGMDLATIDVFRHNYVKYGWACHSPLDRPNVGFQKEWKEESDDES